MPTLQGPARAGVMLHWIGLALLALAGFLVYRWMIARRGNHADFPWIAVGLLVVLGAACIAPWFLRVRLEDKLSLGASDVAGRKVSVRCQSFGAAFFDPSANLGHVAFNAAGQAEPRTLIKRDQCRDLSGYMSSDKQAPTQEQIVAVHVLTHESMHMAGVTAEAEAECQAVGNDARMAELLGAPPDAARALALSYWTNVYPRMPDQYRSTECDPWAPRT
jgi:hypothetical protein